MPPHCDSKDGPVVLAALQALDNHNADEALRFAPEQAEQEIRAAFAKAVEAREAGGAAKEVADLFFAETVVRLHRAGEGAAYTGLKPAGLDVGPAIPIAERTIETGTVDELVTMLSDALKHEAEQRFDHLMELERQSHRGLREWRDYTSAMLGLQVWCHKLYTAIQAAPHEGHEDHH